MDHHQNRLDEQERVRAESRTATAVVIVGLVAVAAIFLGIALVAHSVTPL